MLTKLRIKLLKLLIGKLSVMANVKCDGSVLVGSGFIYNNHFVPRGGLYSLQDTITYSDRIIAPYFHRRHTVIEYNVMELLT